MKKPLRTVSDGSKRPLGKPKATTLNKKGVKRSHDPQGVRAVNRMMKELRAKKAAKSEERRRQEELFIPTRVREPAP